jgi:hypothetical protein
VAHGASVLAYAAFAWLVLRSPDQAIAFGLSGALVVWRWVIPPFREPRDLDLPVRSPDDIRMNATGRPWV